MPSSRLRLIIGALLLCLVPAGCSTTIPNEGQEPSWRRLIITVDTIGTDRSAILLVGDDAGQPVGRAMPSIVPPRLHTPVTIDVPSGLAWRIFVNGKVIMVASDVPSDAAGRVPITIFTGSGPWGPPHVESLEVPGSLHP